MLIKSIESILAALSTTTCVLFNTVGLTILILVGEPNSYLVTFGVFGRKH